MKKTTKLAVQEETNSIAILTSQIHIDANEAKERYQNEISQKKQSKTITIMTDNVTVVKGKRGRKKKVVESI